jgi:hypothetical protein
LKPVHGRGISFVEEIEEFEEHLCLHPLSNFESLGNPHVHIGKGGCG